MPQQVTEWPTVQSTLLRFALGHVPQSVMAAYMSCRIIAGDREEADKVRPLGLGNFIRKCINRAKARTFKNRVAAAVSPLQYAVGGDRGAETMHKTALADLDVRGSACLCAFDVKNAHNEFEHEDALRAIEQLVPAMMPWASPELRTATSHVYVGPSGGTLQLPKDRGGDQGDPFVGWIFPLTYHGVVAKTQAAAMTVDPGARAYAYQDDLDMVLAPGAKAVAPAAYQAACADVGLRSNCAKETISPGRLTRVEDLPTGVEINARPVVLRHSATSFPVLPATLAASGSQLAENSAEIVALTQRRRNLYARLSELSKAGLSNQACLTLLHQRTGGDAVFLARACGIPAADAIRLDAELRSTIKKFTDPTGWTQNGEQRMLLPGKAWALASPAWRPQPERRWQRHGTHM